MINTIKNSAVSAAHSRQILKSAWLIWSLAAAFYFYEYFLQVSPGVMVPELMRSFNVTAGALGNLAAFYFYAYAAMQLPVGILIDRYGPRLLLTISAFICIGGCLLFGLAFNLSMAKMGRFLIGIGSAFALVGTFKLAANWFPVNRFALVTGITVTIAMLGAIGGQTPLALLVQHIGWRESMVLLSVAGGILSIAIWRRVQDTPPIPVATIPTEVPQKGLLDGLKIVSCKKQSWLVAIYGGLMFAPTSIFGSLWGVPFLVRAYSLSRPDAAALISLLFVGWAVGSPIGGWYSDHIGKRLPPLWIAAVGALISMLLLLYCHVLSLVWVGLWLFLFGFFSSGFIPSYSIIREINPENVSATALSFMNMLNMIGGALGQPLVGWILDKLWNGQLDDGIRFYSLANFHVALTILPLCPLLALITLLFVKETNCQRTTV